MNEVRYVQDGDNSVLRQFLVDAWKQQCYWCREYRTFTALQIDHILPKTATPTQRRSLAQRLNLGDDYDPHALSNLAPICGVCNTGKSNGDYTESPLILTQLKKAHKLAPTIAKRVLKFPTPSKLDQALLLARTVDLTDPDTLDVFDAGVRPLVQRLADFSETAPEYLISQTLWIEARDDRWQVKIVSNEAARSATSVFEQVAGGDLETSLSVPVSDLFVRVAEAVSGQFESYGLGSAGSETGDVEVNRAAIIIDELSFAAIPGTRLEFDFGGVVDAELSASIARSEYGDLEYVQGDAIVGARFSFILCWEITNTVGEFDFDAVFLDDFSAEVWIDGVDEFPWSLLGDPDSR